MEKVLVFAIYKNKLLLLLGSDNDPQFHESFWYVITGGMEKEDTTLIDTVKRELKEETNLIANEIYDLKWTFEYESLGKCCMEHAFVVFVDNNKVSLNEESIDYEWCNFEEFLAKIKWFYDKNELRDKLSYYFNKN